MKHGKEESKHLVCFFFLLTAVFNYTSNTIIIGFLDRSTEIRYESLPSTSSPSFSSSS